jgi:hypothetical protein
MNLICHEDVDLNVMGPADFFYLTPFVPPLHFMERGIGGEVLRMSTQFEKA